MILPKDRGNVRNLAYLALPENDQNSRRSRICRMRHVIVSRGVSSIRVFYKALGRASSETWILSHATFSFAPNVMCKTTGAEEKYENSTQK